jgi:hypothetical protein
MVTVRGGATVRLVSCLILDHQKVPSQNSHTDLLSLKIRLMLAAQTKRERDTQLTTLQHPLNRARPILESLRNLFIARTWAVSTEAGGARRKRDIPDRQTRLRRIPFLTTPAWRRGRRRRSHGSWYAIANRRARGLGTRERSTIAGSGETAAACSEGSQWPSPCEPR